MGGRKSDFTALQRAPFGRGFEPESLGHLHDVITYYAPWGNLAIFYRDFGYSAGLVNWAISKGALTRSTCAAR